MGSGAAASLKIIIRSSFGSLGILAPVVEPVDVDIIAAEAVKDRLW